MYESHGQQYYVSFDYSPGIGNSKHCIFIILIIPYYFLNFNPCNLIVGANKSDSCKTPVSFASFFVRGRCLEHFPPVWPWIVLSPTERRFRQDLNLSNACSFLSDGCSHTVGACITATYY